MDLAGEVELARGERARGVGVGGVGGAGDGGEAGWEEGPLAVERVLGVSAVGARRAEVVFFVERGAGVACGAEGLVDVGEEVRLFVEVEGDIRDGGEAWWPAGGSHCACCDVVAVGLVGIELSG